MHVNPLLVASFFLGMQQTAEAATFKMEDKRSFSVARVANPNFKGINGPHELYRTYRKYGMPIPDGLKSRITAEQEAKANTERRERKRRGQFAPGSGGAQVSSSSIHPIGHASNSTHQTGSVAAKPESGDIAYLCPVDIGGQTLNLDFDTGSADLWVFDTALPASSTKGHSVYDASKSSTFKKVDGASWKIQYGDGSGASGTVGTDVVTVGGAVVQAQAVELATQISDQFSQDVDNDGLLGLAWSNINTVKPQAQKTFFDNIMDSLEQPVFTANLKHGTDGSYDFGKIDKSLYSGDLTYVPIDNSQGFWQFPTGSGDAIADTGTTLALAAEDIVTAYYKGVQGAKNDQQAGGYTFPCDTELPDLKLKIGDSYTATIPGKLVNLAPVQEGSSDCFGGLQVTTQQGLGVYGDILFKGQFVVFDGAKKQIGLAPHA